MRTIIAGVGNPYCGDDGVGWQIVREVENQFDATPQAGIEFFLTALGGIALMEKLIGFDRAIVVDAIHMESGKLGHIHILTPEDLPKQLAVSPHGASFREALALGASLGLKLPKQITIVAVEIQVPSEFCESLTPAVEASIQPAAQLVRKALTEDQPPGD